MVIYRDERGGGGGGPVEISIHYTVLFMVCSVKLFIKPMHSPSINDFISPCVLLKDKN